jgi:hypothetical protein
MTYQSTVTLESRACAGVRFTVARMSLGRRIELTKRIRELAQRSEFLAAGDELREKAEAAVLDGEVERLYLDWGLVGIEGLEIDGEPATKESLAGAGPEELSREIVAAIRAECGLTEEERKN